ncbi:proteasome subunit alpha type-1-like [Varroa jacobsoni]|uniref:Proteasome subunit alpha type n=1 Tax=Varroa destructor TaxID=109461 RepID=A0A7M7KQ83_VARDE|nr:proteasome subunit alpha type-1-like [Varroa destructor]XP_022697911.1 proteasome subunit alpha type-1-like [Varroa jacobsoni]
MYRNQYDNDVTVWSPQGRLHQVEYAMEAVKQGSATIGLKNADYAILLALKRASSELSAHQKKIIPIDRHIGVSLAGLTADARILSKYLRNECLNNRFAHECALPISRLATRMGNKMQVCTQRYDRRPYGVGLLMAGWDENGPHIYQTCPSANFYDCKAMAIGARSQSARTYLEKHLDQFKTCSLEDLMKHGLRALRDCLPNDVELGTKNVSIAIVGKDRDFTIYEDDACNQFLGLIAGEERTRGGGVRDRGAEEAEEQMEQA